MDRRNVLKSAGIFSVSSYSLAGITQAAAGKGVEEYEDYANSLVRNFGKKKRGAIAIRDSPERVNTIGFESERGGHLAEKRDVPISIQQELSEIHGDSECILAEKYEYETGDILTQKVRSISDEILEISINGKQFIVHRPNLKRLLQGRLEKSRRRRSTKRRPKELLPKTTNEDYIAPGFISEHKDGDRVPVTSQIWVSTDKTASGNHFNVTEVAGQASLAGLADGTAEAYSASYDGSELDYLEIEFKGSYKARGYNAIADSELKFELFVEDEDGNELEKEVVLRESSFVADYWSRSDTFQQDMYVPSLPNETIIIGMRTYVECAAAGPSTTTINASSEPSLGDYDGGLELDEYITPNDVFE